MKEFDIDKMRELCQAMEKKMHSERIKAGIRAKKEKLKNEKK